ncbi:MAG: 3-hydroxyacyl-CoA dehydrogenase [Legionellales bacterium]|nr:3-hydroxyacyl-CoA dehydrogenase [Legionellales bacterium]OUX66972.1 MAG: hypothetical protein CBD38_04390 [bacterium TMED178]|tara:strand:+ start:3718 stop:5817 length:2100 start_codon:yes stop_codon:yes gene_type:complete
MENHVEPVEIKIHQGGIAVIWMDHPPLNTLSQPLRDALFNALKTLNRKRSVQVIILAAKNQMFSAGADIKEFKTGFQGASLQAIQEQLESSQKLTIAAMHHSALGGGLEIALACHYRVAEADTQFTLPEVTLGFIPGAGGTQRLPRIIGVKKALKMIISGRPVNAKTALADGLLDQVFKQDLIESSIQYAQQLLKKKAKVRPTKDRPLKLKKSETKEALTKWITKDIQLIAKRVGLTAPECCRDAVLFSLESSFLEGLDQERDLFFKAVLSPESQALQYVFFSQRQAARLLDQVSGTVNNFFHVGIVGGGLMGSGIAMTMINAGIKVTIIETDENRLKACMARIQNNYQISIQNGRYSAASVTDRLGLLQGETHLTALKYCDLVIEAVFEDMAVKKALFQSLKTICPSETIFASNTSALNINELAKMVDYPDKFIGLHFFSPANVTRLLEIVRGDKTSDRVVNMSLTLAKTIKKNPVVVGVCPGFVGNRMIFKYLEQADQLALQGLKPHEIDEMIQSFGFLMGPFAMSDLTGLDLGWVKPNTAKNLRDVMCLNNRLGQKNGHGFYDYPEKRVAVPSETANQLIADFAASKSITIDESDTTEVVNRLVYALINEGLKILGEGIVKRASDIDIIYVYGYGWPAYRGGPMYYAQQVGLSKILDQMNIFKERYGSFWEPAPLLQELVATDTRLKDWVYQPQQE